MVPLGVVVAFVIVAFVVVAFVVVAFVVVAFVIGLLRLWLLAGLVGLLDGGQPLGDRVCLIVFASLAQLLDLGLDLFHHGGLLGLTVAAVGDVDERGSLQVGSVEAGAGDGCEFETLRFHAERFRIIEDIDCAGDGSLGENDGWGCRIVFGTQGGELQQGG